MPKFRRCRVRGCESTSGGVVRLFSFPNDRELAEKWKHNLKIFPTDHFPSTNAFVCEKHFAKAAIGTKMLKKNTVPTLNLDIEFDASLADEERRFYLRAYPSVDLVRERKVHCTVCKTHIGTAPSQEENIRMHPVLRVTHCLKCHDFYNSGEFSKGEDGSELYCRWCGQGGEVYCCSSCPYVFCKSCIVKNLSRGVVVDIEQNENWNCFSCAPKILWPLRAQHWALIRYIDKQKKYIDVNHPNESEKRALLSQDRSTCCRLAKSKCGNMSDSMESLDSATSRRSQSSSSAKKHSKSPGNHPQVPPAKRMKNSNDEVVCTPDLLSMLEPDCQITVQQKTRPAPSPITSTPKIISLQTHSSSPNSSGITLKPHNNTPPPLVLRNTGIPIRHPSPAPIVRRTIIGARNAPTTGNHTPVYHTINGYRIDLNSAAQQETFRLPNGKLIQVKRQGTNQPQPSTPSPSNAWMRQASPITAIQHAASGRPVQITPARTYYSVSQQHQQNSMQQPQMIRYSNTTVTPVSGQNGAIRGTQIQLINGVPVAPTAAPATVNSATAVRAPVMVRHVFPDTAIGQARSQLQDQVFNAMEICQHLTGKVQTLTNSNAYKQARNYLEVKELYIHLSYLLTYAIGRFKGLQDKCLGDMRQLGFVNDADSLENGQLAAGVDYVRYGQLEDIDLFNTSANSFHNQVYEYRKSLHANMENGEGNDKKPPLSPLMPLGQLKRGGADGEDDEDYGENDETGDNSWMKNTMDEPTYYDDGVDMSANDDVDATADADGDDDENDADADGAADFEQYVAQQQQAVRYSNKAHYGTEDYMSQEEQTHARDRKLARLIEKYPAIWCTRHPDYGNFEVTRKYWRIVATHFKRTENIKLRWKNIRKRYVRVERRIHDGKRFNGYFDKTTNFLANRDLPEDQWLEVDCGSDDDEAQQVERKKPNVIEKSALKDDQSYDWNNEDCAEDANDYEMSDGVKALEVRALDMKIINFVKCNPVLWRKSGDSQYNSVDVQSRKSLWMHLWRSLRSQSSMLNDLNCEDIMDRWSHLYEMYKSFRLKTIKSESKRANLELKYSKYLAKLSFLYKIVEEDLRNEHLENIDIDFTQEVTENDNRLQDEPDDKEFMLQLVRTVQRYPLLWDSLNVDYYDQVLRSNFWQDIASALKDFKRNATTIKMRWQLALFSYKRYLRERFTFPKDKPLPKYCRSLPVDEMFFLDYLPLQ
uniref:Transcriptional regulator ATRX n=2 Tax=Bactrocera latifrons TaxID=174628 RepID=A0A0K8VA04_BACLA